MSYSVMRDARHTSVIDVRLLRNVYLATERRFEAAIEGEGRAAGLTTIFLLYQPLLMTFCWCIVF